MSPQAHKARETVSWTLSKLNHFWAPKPTIKKAKSQLTEWEKIFASHTSGVRLVSRIHKEFLEMKNLKKQNTQFKNVQRIWIPFLLIYSNDQQPCEKMLNIISYQRKTI